MKLGLLLILFAFAAECVSGQLYDSSYGKPLIVLTETDPWAMVIGSDGPSFAVYESGRIIYRKVAKKKVEVYESKLTQSEQKNIAKIFGLTDSLYKLPNYIEASTSTDEPSNNLIVDFDSMKVIRVYGHINVGSEVNKAIPAAFLQVYDSIKKYTSKSAKKWLPSTIEVMFWDYDYAPNKRAWPSIFPDLNSPTTIKKRNGLYSVFIPRNQFHEFKKYFTSMGEKQAVEINGRKMSISYRLPFPNIK